MESVETRAARPEDWPGIESIGDVYYGTDYMKAYFPWMLHSTNCHPLVTTVNGQVVSFCNFYVIEEGRCVLGMSSRVSEKYRGLHYSGVMKSYMYSEIHRLYPEVDTAVYTARASDFVVENIKNPDTKVTRQWHFCDVICSREVLWSAVEKLGEQERGIQDVVTLTLSDCMKRAEEACTVLKKDGSSFVHNNNWIALRINNDNLRLAALNSDVMATYNESNQLKSLSFTTILSNDTGMAVSVFYYGDSVEECLKHLIRVMMRVAGMSPVGTTDKIAILCHFPSHVSWVDISAFFSEYLGPPLSPVFNAVAAEKSLR